MEITINDKQYEKLVKLIYLGMWIVESDENQADNYFTEIEQLIYLQAKNINDSKLIQFDKVAKKYFPTIDFDKEDIIANYIDAYDENCFWEELIDRLTKRDMVKKFGLEHIHQMAQEEIFEKEKEFIEKYEHIFEESGILKLFIKNENEK